MNTSKRYPERLRVALMTSDAEQQARIALARKRSAAKRYLRRNGWRVAWLPNASTALIVQLCQITRDNQK